MIVFGTWESTLRDIFFWHLLSVRVQKKLLKISSFKHNQFCIFLYMQSVVFVFICYEFLFFIFILFYKLPCSFAVHLRAG